MEKQSTELTALNSGTHTQAQQVFLQRSTEDRKEYKTVAASSWVGSPQPRACPARPRPSPVGKETGLSLTSSPGGRSTSPRPLMFGC